MKIFEKIKSRLLLLLLVPIFLSIHSDQSVTITKESSKKLVFEKEYKNQLNNFIFLVKTVSMLELTDLHSTASGMIISSTRSHVFILTANHFCTDETELVMFKTDIIAHNNDKPRLAQIIYIDQENDLCLLSAIKYKGEKFKNLKLAKDMPPLGEFVFNVAAPNGMGSPQTRLLFDGHFGGCEEICVYTIPATFGSSGSAVFNSKGELISVLVMATEDFENVGIGPDIYTIRNFIDKINTIMATR